MKIQFALLSIILLSALAVVIPSNANAQTNDITLTSVLDTNICVGNLDCIKQLNSVHFVNDKIGWVVGNSGVILYTTDGGTTWTEQTNSVTTALNSVHFADDKIGWVVGNSGVILYTTDGGTTWTEQTNSVTTALNSVHFADDKIGWVVGNSGVILRTVDGGTTWTEQTSTVTSTLQSVHFADNTFGWVVGEDGVILDTVNGGQAWTKQIINDSDFLNSVHFVDHNYGWAISSGSDASIFFTANGGTTWTEQTIPNGDNLEVLLNSVHFTNSNNGLIVGSYVDSDVGFILYTTNGGVTWTEQTSNAPSNLRSVQFTDSNKALVVGGNERDQVILHLTMPLGDTITLTPMNSINICGDNADCEQNLSDTHLQSVHFTDRNNGWIVGGSNAILQTTDGGNTWTGQTSTNGNNLNSVHFANNNGWAVGRTNSGQGVIQHTDEIVPAWTGQNIPSGFAGPTPLNSVHFANDDIGWAVGLNYAPQRGVILHTVNGGTTWTEQTSNVNTELRSVHFVNDKIGWAVGDNGVILRTVDGGTTWTGQTSTVTSTLHSVHFVDDNNGWAVGVNGVILHTTDGGTTWTKHVVIGPNTLNSVHFTDSNNGWIVGTNQLILYTVNGGSTWVDQTPSTGSGTLNSVHFTDRNNGWAVGDKANIIHITVIPPAAPVITSQTTRTNDNPYTITGTTENGSTVTLTQNNGDSTLTPTIITSSDGIWSVDVTLIQGDNTFTATATDQAGNTSVVSNSVTVTLDTTAPAAPVITPPVTLTSTNTLEITGTAENGSTVTLTQNDIALTPTIITSSTGTWSIDVTLIQDANTFTATATDQAGNISDASTPVTVTRDTAPPPAPVITSPASPETSTNEYTHKITGTAENDSTITLTQNITVLESVTVGSNGIWSIDVTLGYGTNIFTATASDQAGNTSKDSTSIMVIFDDTPPAAPIITSEATSTTETAHTITGTANVGYPDVDSTVTLTQNSVALKSVPIGSDGTWSVSVTLREGENTLTATASDQAGNTSVVSNSVTVTRDTPAPAAPVITPPVTLTSTNTLEITGTTENGSTVTLTQNNGDSTLTPTIITSSDGIWSVDVTLIQGDNTFTATATDQAGNTSVVSNSVTVTLDTTAPAAPVITPPVTLTSTNTLEITGTTENGSTVTLTQNNGDSTLTPTIITSSDGIWSVDVTLIQGDNTFTATATDQAGNTSVVSNSVTVTLDTTAPAAPVITPPVTLTSTNTLEITGTTENGSTVTLTQNNGDSTLTPTIITSSDGTWSVDVTLIQGANTFTATATDQAGNISNVSNSVTVTLDNAAPIITLTGANPQTIESGADYTELGATTDDGFEVSVDSSAYRNVVGTYIITYTATDGTNQATATRTVNVVDTTAPVAPVITLQTPSTNADTHTIAGTAENGSTVTLTRNSVALVPTATTNSNGAWSIEVTLQEGANIFTATASDQAGNTSDVSNSVTVTLDNTAPDTPTPDTTAPTAPVITSEATSTNKKPHTITGTAENGSTVTLRQNVTVLESVTVGSDGIWSIDVTLGAGTNTFTATATDQAGNTSKDSAPIMVIFDNLPPAAPIITSEATSTTETAHTITGTANVGYPDVDSTVTLTQNSVALKSVPIGSNGAWSVSVTLGAGTNTFTATASDQAGNTSVPSTPVTVTLDTTAPAAPDDDVAHNQAQSPPQNLQTTSASIIKVHDGTKFVEFSDGMTINSGTPKFRGTSTGISSIQILLGDSQVGGNGVRSDGTFSKGWDNDPLADGTYTITVTDKIGDERKRILYSSSIIIDKDGDGNPNAAITKVRVGTEYMPFEHGMTINSGTPKFKGTSTGISSIQILLGDSQVGGNKISSDGSFIKGWKGDPLTDGTYSLTVSDNVNPETILFTSYIIIDANSDNNPINAQITKVRVGTEYVPFEHGMTINPETLKFRGTSDGIDSVKVMIDGNQVGGNNIRDNGIFAKGWKGNTLTDGTYSLTVSDNNNPETILFTSYIIIQNPVN